MPFDFPASPTTGQVFNAPTGQGYVYSGTAWNLAQTSPQAPVASDNPPANPYAGQLWLRSTTGALYMWYTDPNSSQWIQIPGAIPPVAPQAWELIDNAVITSQLGYNLLNLSAFDMLKVTGSLHMDSASTSIAGYVSSNNGTSFFNGATDYWLQYLAGAAAVASAAKSDNPNMPLSNGISVINGPNTGGFNFILNLFRFNKTGYLRAHLDAAVQTFSTGQLVTVQSNIGCVQTTPKNAISIQGGQPWTGHIIVEGLRG